MKTAVSVPDEVFRAAEQLASHLGISRSELCTKAIAGFVGKHSGDLITSRLNEICGLDRERSSLDAGLAALQHHTLASHRICAWPTPREIFPFRSREPG